jgi:hypothetical protein
LLRSATTRAGGLLLLVFLFRSSFVISAQNPTSRFTARFSTVYSLDFERTLPAWLAQMPPHVLVSGEQALSGDYSIRLSESWPYLLIPALELRLEQGGTYLVEYDYYVRDGIRPDRPNGVGATFFVTQQMEALWRTFGPGEGGQSLGTATAGLRIGNLDGVSILLVAMTRMS